MGRYSDNWFKTSLEQGVFTRICDGYLYSTRTGLVTVRKGVLYNRNNCARIHDDHYEFVYDPDNYSSSRIICEKAAGVVYQKALWLPERDDELAKELFIEHDEKCIEKLKNDIQAHQMQIVAINNLQVLVKE